MELRGIRGKLDVSSTVKRDLLRIPATVCLVDELSHDVLHNQIIKATMVRLAGAAQLVSSQRSELLRLCKRMADVSAVGLRRDIFRRVQLHSNNSFYRFLLNVCELCYTCLLPDDRAGTWRFMEFERDEVQMRKVFEGFIYNFYRLEQSTYSVSRERFSWNTDEGATELPLMPMMETDVSLESSQEKIVIECKFTPQALHVHREKISARSAHLYQLYAYLRNLEGLGGTNSFAQGILLYPTAADSVDFCFHVAGHRVRVFTLNLNRDWNLIAADLLGLIGMAENENDDPAPSVAMQ
jgi:5-methylcytosine-specific restriction enzyme subunit McrC